MLETAEEVEIIIQQNHIQGVAFVQRLPCGAAAEFPISLSYSFSFFPRKGL